MPHAGGHVKRPASPFATRGVDVKDLGLDEIALDLDPQNLLGSGDELQDRCYLGPRHAVREHAHSNTVHWTVLWTVHVGVDSPLSTGLSSGQCQDLLSTLQKL